MPSRVSERRPGFETLSQGSPAGRPPRLGLRIVILVLVTVAAALAWKTSAYNRLANLAYRGEGGFPETFLMLSKSRAGRGYLVDRRGSTIRRSQRKIAGNTSDLARFGEDPASGIPEHWLARSKTYGTELLVPVDAVADWTYPFLYGFVRERHPELELPEATWTHLHVNRTYRGLYYRLKLPYDLRKKDGGTGIRRELLMVEGNAVAVLDTRFDPTARLYANLVADGIMPSLVEPSPVLSWLAARQPKPEQATFLLTAEAPWKVRRLPLPISIRDFCERQRGRPLEVTTDERFREWVEPEAAPAATSGTAATSVPFSDATSDTLRTEFARYASDFRVAYRAHRLLHSPAMDADLRRVDLALHLDVRP